MTKVKITECMCNQLEYDNNTREMASAENAPSTSKDAGASAPEQTEVEPAGAAAIALLPPPRRLSKPTLMVVFNGSDLKAAVFHLLRSASQPFAPQAIATVLVQEDTREIFIKMIKAKLKPMSPEVAMNENYLRSAAAVQRLKAKTLQSNAPDSKPVFVCDVYHHQLGEGATGFITLHSFRAVHDAVTRCTRESLIYANATIWNEKYLFSYDFVALLACRVFYFNCAHVTMDPIKQCIADHRNYVTIDRNYHYESIFVRGRQKGIVMPIGHYFSK